MQFRGSRGLGRLAMAAVALLFALALATPGWAIGRGGDLPAMRKITWLRASAGAAPEIDPGTLRGAIAIVAGGLAILRDRRRR